MARAKRHVHKYHYIVLPMMGSKVWACRLPDCNHYMPKYMEPTIEGKSSICWGCDETFILTLAAMAEDMPRCEKCRGIDVDEASAVLRQYLESKEKEEKIKEIREAREIE